MPLRKVYTLLKQIHQKIIFCRLYYITKVKNYKPHLGLALQRSTHVVLLLQLASNSAIKYAQPINTKQKEKFNFKSS